MLLNIRYSLQKKTVNGAIKIIDNSRLCLQDTLVEMLGRLQDNMTGSCSILKYRIEISTANENGQADPTIWAYSCKSSGCLRENSGDCQICLRHCYMVCQIGSQFLHLILYCFVPRDNLTFAIRHIPDFSTAEPSPSPSRRPLYRSLGCGWRRGVVSVACHIFQRIC